MAVCNIPQKKKFRPIPEILKDLERYRRLERTSGRTAGILIGAAGDPGKQSACSMVFYILRTHCIRTALHMGEALLPMSKWIMRFHFCFKTIDEYRELLQYCLGRAISILRLGYLCIYHNDLPSYRYQVLWIFVAIICEHFICVHIETYVNIINKSIHIKLHKDAWISLMWLKYG